MMVTFISQCEKNALKKTRRVLDAFANRIGDNAWQTIITQEGLATVRKMLRQTASKSTAVSCHWIRSRSRSQFLWVVGNKKKFNHQGHVAVNWTEKSLLTTESNNDWKYLPLIKSITQLAALLHDWGKASKLFQDKLNPAIKTRFKGDPIRHEWISCLIFHAFIKSSGDLSDDKSWLQMIMNETWEKTWEEAQLKNVSHLQEKKPLHQLPNAATLIMWLIVSHHRLPLPKEELGNYLGRENKDLQVMLKKITMKWGYQNRYDEKQYKKYVDDCFCFPQGLLLNSTTWKNKLKQWAKDLFHHLHLVDAAMNDGSWRVVLHHSRLCLMLGDHYYSSQQADDSWQSELSLFANTNEKKELKQKLDEHLVGVAKIALNTTKLLPYFETEPEVATELDALKPSSNTPDQFCWQDKAVNKIKKWQDSADDEQRGAFIVNMASTGRGKTLANAKIMQALSDDGESLRFILALGLRTLTLQTGDEYRNRIGLNSSQLAVLIGSQAVKKLHQSAQSIDDEAADEQEDDYGAESATAISGLQTGEQALEWQGILPEDELTTILKCDKDRQLLYAPVLACTIDHMMAATETIRAGRYILPCLRLMSSDLVIDEIDDFTGSDLVAIGRLVHLAAMLGRKVMISSATIPLGIALGYFNTYQEGWKIYAASRGKTAKIDNIWLDEYSCFIETLSISEKVNIYQVYADAHDDFVDKRLSKLIEEQQPKCKAKLGELDINAADKQQAYFECIKQHIVQLHHGHHVKDNKTDIKVSFGVVRCANISPCVELTTYLLETDFPEGVEVRVMAYHSQQVLLLRHHQEQHLDAVLKRKEQPGEPPQAFSHPEIRSHLDSCQQKDLIFILVATPVEEVGRDHDFDWGIIEPSSYRSIIQLAGRILRHRILEILTENIVLLQYNWLGFVGNSEYAFCNPGYETSPATKLVTHDLAELVDLEQLALKVDSIPRIKQPKNLQQNSKLADLEHFATAELLTKFDCPYADSLQGYLTGYWHLTALPQKFHPFRKSTPSINLYWVEEDNGSLKFKERNKDGQLLSVEKILAIENYQLTDKQNSRLWLQRDFKQLLAAHCPDKEKQKNLAILFGEINFTHRDGASGYRYNPQLGLVRSK
jgi:CRISPR-associated endonuclease/helicase Cas3